jgi:hypothetical protein
VQFIEGGFRVDDGEVSLRITREDGAVVVHKTWRNDDRGVVMASGDPADVDRYLTLAYVNGVRAGHKLDRLRPFLPSGSAPGTVAPGFRLDGRLGRGFELVPVEGEREPRRFFESDLEASRFSYCSTLDADEIRRRSLRESRDLLAE